MSQQLSESRSELIKALHELINEHTQILHTAIDGTMGAYRKSGQFIELTEAVLNGLLWNKFKTRSTGGWIYRNSKDDTLVSLEEFIIKSGGSAELHGFYYKLSGDKRQFINRFPRNNHR